MTTQRYSYSRIQTYAACPTRFKFRYIDQLSPLVEAEHDLRFGKAWDAAMNAWYLSGSGLQAQEAFALAYPEDEYPAVLPHWSPGKSFIGGYSAIAQYVNKWADDDQWWEVLSVQSREHKDGDDESRTVVLDLVVRDKRDGMVYGVDNKAQPLWSNLLTPNGWTSMGSAFIGMPVFGRDGGVHEIVGVYPQGMKECFEVTFNDGSKVHCSGDHLWTVTMQFHDKEVTLPLHEINRRMSIRREVKRNPNDPRSGIYSYKYRVPLNEPIELPERDLPINPYLLGALLGDGCLCVNSPQISIGNLDKDATLENLRECLPSYVELRKCRGANFSWTLADATAKKNKGAKRYPNRLFTVLGELGLRGRKSHDKFVPPSYLNASVNQRLHLLQGLLDTDGCCSDGHIFFDSTSPQLANDVVALVRSLGGFAQVRKVKRPEGNLPSNRVSIRPLEDAQMFRLERKQSKVRPLALKGGKYISKIELVGVANMQCIKTSAPDGLYITDGYTVTHNTTGKYLDSSYASQFDPHSQIRQYVRHLQEQYDDVGGFYINAASFRHRTKAYTPRKGPDKGVQLPAGDWCDFKRYLFNPNAEAIAQEARSFTNWISKIEGDMRSGNFAYNTDQCVRGPLVCPYHKICSAGYDWPRDAELITQYYQQRCMELVDGERCWLPPEHTGEHDATKPAQADYQVDLDDEIEEAEA